MHQENRRSFVKKSLATSVSISFAGLIRAHGEEGGSTTTWNPNQSTIHTTFSGTTTWNPDGTTYHTTVGGTTTWDPNETTDTTSSTTVSESYILTCISEPLDGDWGGNISDMVSINDPSNYDLSTIFLAGQRAWSSAFAITNYINPTWNKQCIRKGCAGRNNGTTSTICAAAAYALTGNSVAGMSTKKAIPKMRMSISCNPTTGELSATTSGSGIDEGDWDGSHFKATSKITSSYVDGNTKHIKVKIVW